MSYMYTFAQKKCNDSKMQSLYVVGKNPSKAIITTKISQSMAMSTREMVSSLAGNLTKAIKRDML